MKKLYWRSIREIRFSSSRVIEGLPTNNAQGKMHGHNFKVGITIGTFDLDEIGMVLDPDILQAIEKRLDHRHLNDVMGGLNPTAENLARFLYDTVNKLILDIDLQDSVKVEKVVVLEDDQNAAELSVVGTDD